MDRKNKQPRVSAVYGVADGKLKKLPPEEEDFVVLVDKVRGTDEKEDYDSDGTTAKIEYGDTESLSDYFDKTNALQQLISDCDFSEVAEGYYDCPIPIKLRASDQLEPKFYCSSTKRSCREMHMRAAQQTQGLHGNVTDLLLLVKDEKKLHKLLGDRLGLKSVRIAVLGTTLVIDGCEYAPYVLLEEGRKSLHLYPCDKEYGPGFVILCLTLPGLA
jgi:hypothetical protein